MKPIKRPRAFFIIQLWCINKMKYEAVIGLEVHAELLTDSKMFCSCPVVDSTQAAPNIAVCPVCAGMPGVLPVVNKKAVEYAMRVALALECEIAHLSLFDRKNYFYPDLPKGYQISQFEYPLAQHGRLLIHTAGGEKEVRILRTHLEEDAGKLTHVQSEDQSYSLVDLNRAGVGLLEIVSEPDMRSAEEARVYAETLHSIIRYLGVNSGDMSKGVIRFEANVSIREAGSEILNPRVEIKNLNSFRSLERAIVYQIGQQIEKMERGEAVVQETVGWDETSETTFSQRSKEEAHDYRYFPEPDLPPLVIEQEWIDQVAAALPELPLAKAARFEREYDLNPGIAQQLVQERSTADFYEAVLRAGPSLSPKTAAAWVTGELSNWMNQSGECCEELRVSPAGLAELLLMIQQNEINQTTAKAVLSELLQTGGSAIDLVAAKGLKQISNAEDIAGMIQTAIAAHPKELASYLDGKETLSNWFFGQVMRAAKGKANPQIVRAELERQLNHFKGNPPS